MGYLYLFYHWLRPFGPCFERVLRCRCIDWCERLEGIQYTSLTAAKSVCIDRSRHVLLTSTDRRWLAIVYGAGLLCLQWCDVQWELQPGAIINAGPEKLGPLWCQVTVYHYNDTRVTRRSLNVAVRYILRCFCLRDIRLIISMFIKCSLKLLISLQPGLWLTSPAGWLPVHRDQLRAQRSVTSMGKLYLLPFHTDSAHCSFRLRSCIFQSMLGWSGVQRQPRGGVTRSKTLPPPPLETLHRYFVVCGIAPMCWI